MLFNDAMCHLGLGGALGEMGGALGAGMGGLGGLGGLLAGAGGAGGLAAAMMNPDGPGKVLLCCIQIKNVKIQRNIKKSKRKVLTMMSSIGNI